MATMTAHAETAGTPGTVRLPRLAWVVWRQHRIAMAGLLVLAAGAAVAFIVSGLRIHAVYAPYVSAHCASRPVAPCGDVANDIANFKEAFLPIALHALPVLIGMFLGAPLLAREFESGTFRFAWTQQVDRARWLLAKLLMIGAVVGAVCLALGVLASWWLQPFNGVGVSSRWQMAEFDVTPIVLAGWGVLAFAAGVLAGALLKRTVPAMAVTALAVTAVLGWFWYRLGTRLLAIAPHPAVRSQLNALTYMGTPGPSSLNTAAIGTSGPAAGGWLVRGWSTHAGHLMTTQAYDRVLDVLQGNGAHQGVAAPARWLAAHQDASWVTYQPGSRFWDFQTVTGAALLLLALALAATAITVIRRRA